jgi:hypothetical protein
MNHKNTDMMFPRAPIAISSIASLFIVAALWADEEPKQSSSSLEGQFKALLEEAEEVEPPREFAGKFMELAEKHPQDPIAVDALIWIVTNVRRGSELTGAMNTLANDHVENEKLAPVFAGLIEKPSLAAEKLLRAALEKNPHKKVQAQACFQLAAYLRDEARLRNSLMAQPDHRRFEQYYGKEFTKHLAAIDEKKLTEEIEHLYERIVESFADVPTDDGPTLGESAKLELFAIRNLALGKTAPEIQSEDLDGERFKLSDYRGKVVVLDFWGHW